MLRYATARRRAFAALATALLIAAPACFTPRPDAQQRVTLPGTSVTLTAPPGFALARDGKGLEHSASGSTLSIAERPAAAYADLAARFSSAKSLSEFPPMMRPSRKPVLSPVAGKQAAIRRNWQPVR